MMPLYKVEHYQCVAHYSCVCCSALLFTICYLISMPNKKSAIFDHYHSLVLVKSKNGKADSQSAKCKHCDSTVTASIHATSNFKRHMLVSIF